MELENSGAFTKQKQTTATYNNIKESYDAEQKRKKKPNLKE